MANDVRNTQKAFEEALAANAQNTKTLCEATQQILKSMPRDIEALTMEVSALKRKIEDVIGDFSGEVR